MGGAGGAASCPLPCLRPRPAKTLRPQRSGTSTEDFRGRISGCAQVLHLLPLHTAVPTYMKNFVHARQRSLEDEDGLLTLTMAGKKALWFRLSACTLLEACPNVIRVVSYS